MKLNISSTDLLKGLLDVSKAIPSKSPLPILENFLTAPRKTAASPSPPAI